MKESGKQFKGSADTWWFTVIEFVAPGIRHSLRRKIHLLSTPGPVPPGSPAPLSTAFKRIPFRRLHLFRPAVFSSAFSETPGLHNLRGPDLISRRCPAHGPDLPQVSPSRRGCCGRKRRKFVYVKHFEQSTQSNDTKRMCYVFIWVVHSTHVSDFSAEKGQILFSSQINNQ